MLSKLALYARVQAILLPQTPERLRLQVYACVLGLISIITVKRAYSGVD